MPRPIDRERLRADLLEAGRVLTEPLAPGHTEFHRLGALDILLPRIARAAGMPDVCVDLDAMHQARHERIMADYRGAAAELAPLVGEPDATCATCGTGHVWIGGADAPVPA